MTVCLVLTGINIPTAFPGLRKCTFPQEGTEAWGGEQVLRQGCCLSFHLLGVNEWGLGPHCALVCADHSPGILS